MRRVVPDNSYCDQCTLNFPHTHSAFKVVTESEALSKHDPDIKQLDFLITNIGKDSLQILLIAQKLLQEEEEKIGARKKEILSLLKEVQEKIDSIPYEHAKSVDMQTDHTHL